METPGTSWRRKGKLLPCHKSRDLALELPEPSFFFPRETANLYSYTKISQFKIVGYELIFLKNPEQLKNMFAGRIQATFDLCSLFLVGLL